MDFLHLQEESMNYVSVHMCNVSFSLNKENCMGVCNKNLLFIGHERLLDRLLKFIEVN